MSTEIKKERRLSAREWEKKVWDLAKKYGYSSSISASSNKFKYAHKAEPVSSYSAQFQGLSPVPCVVFEESWKIAIEKLERETKIAVENRDKFLTRLGQ